MMIELLAYAKINLGLQVLNNRADGYHNINSVFSRVSLHDTIRIEEHSSLEVICKPSIGISQEKNLAFKAAQLLQSRFNIDVGAKITIHKHIPNGAGLGGASSDAASTLLGLCELWNADCDDAKLGKIALALGSDVPFFLNDGLALASGRGEELSYFRADLPHSVLLVFPNIHISTSWAYSALNIHEEERNAHPLRDVVLMFAADEKTLRRYCVNDFEKVVFKKYPELQTIKTSLYDCGADYAQMSGSGSCIFGLFDSEARALQASRNFPLYRTFVCSLIIDQLVN